MPAFCIRAVYKLSYRGISSGEDGDWGGNVVWTCFERRLISFGRDEQRFLLLFLFFSSSFFFFFPSLFLSLFSKFCTLSFRFPYDVFSFFFFLFILLRFNEISILLIYIFCNVIIFIFTTIVIRGR